MYGLATITEHPGSSPKLQAPKLPSSLAIAGTLGVLLVIVFVFESMQISATNDSPKTHAELTEVEESVI